MNLDEIVATKLVITTACCRSLEYTSFAPSIYQFTGDSSMASPDFQFRLRGKPNGSLIVKIGAYGCDSTLTLQNPFFYPHMFEFNQHSSDLSGKFKISAPMIGCFFVKIYTDSKSYAVYDEDIIMLNVKSVNSPPDPARLFSASFANDGLSILLKFNAETEMEKELKLSFRA